MIRTCPVCESQYDADPSRLKHNRQTTCSRKCSYEMRAKKLSKNGKGKPSSLKGVKTERVPWNKKERIHMSCKHCGAEMQILPSQQGRKKFCSKPCMHKGQERKGLFQKGHPDLVPAEKRGHSEETRRKISAIQRENHRTGPNNPNWRGGLRSARKRAMAQYPYRDWRKSVFSRDNWTCQICKTRGGYLEADHIKPWCLFPDLRYSVDNGRTVCRPCHVRLDTHGHKALRYREN